MSETGAARVELEVRRLGPRRVWVWFRGDPRASGASGEGATLGEAVAHAAQAWCEQVAWVDTGRDHGEALDVARGDWMRRHLPLWASALASWARQQGGRHD